jgi:UDP-hydrolysing UDP-N-acetyl-D-glucosamine 2-epimerase
MKKNIVIITGTRADYGLLKKLTVLLQADNTYETFFAATGTHLSEKHGKTIDLVKNDGIKNIIEVDLKISGDQPQDVCLSLSEGVKAFSELFKKIKPEFIIVLGDRYELWSACMPATIFNIPIVHIHGGESTQGVIDEAVRHSITKMAHLHLCSHDTYKKRIIQLGEKKENVHVVGAVGLDRIKEMAFLTRDGLQKNLGVAFGKKNILCTFHPITIDEKESAKEIEALTGALENILNGDEIKVFITFPNSDTYSSVIQQKWNELIKKYPQCVHGFVNLGDLRYLSLMKEVDLVLGNSSSGILEAPFLNKAVVDIGLRQQGRLRSGHIIHCEGNKNEIESALAKALSDDFQIDLVKTPSIYGNGNSSAMMYDLIRKTNFKNIVFKIFNDGPQQ